MRRARSRRVQLKIVVVVVQSPGRWHFRHPEYYYTSISSTSSRRRRMQTTSERFRFTRSLLAAEVVVAVVVAVVRSSSIVETQTRFQASGRLPGRPVTSCKAEHIYMCRIERELRGKQTTQQSLHAVFFTHICSPLVHARTLGILPRRGPGWWRSPEYSGNIRYSRSIVTN